MKQTLLYFFLIIFCTQGCIKKNDSYTVYNDVLLDVIGTERYHVPFNRIFEFDSLTQIKLWDKYIHVENRPIDQRKLMLVMYDTLNIHSSDLQNLTKLVDTKTEQENNLISKVVSMNSKGKVFDLKRLPSIGRYELCKDSDYKNLRNQLKEKKNSLRCVGYIRISHVAFMDDKQRGCFYVQIVDPGGHGHPAELIFVRKEERWKVEKRLFI